MLGCWCDPRIDFGPEMTSKIIPINGQVLLWSTHGEGGFTEVFCNRMFKESVNKKLGTQDIIKEFDDLSIKEKPQYKTYKDEVKGDRFISDIEE